MSYHHTIAPKRISKSLFYDRGGLMNPKQFRTSTKSGAWQYYSY